ncbi:MAG TPA: ABC transporter permease [Pseudomonadota bacterium]|nr:ABC transporter permease [Pseudomonadota bacterium]
MERARSVLRGPLWLWALPFVWAALLAALVASVLTRLHGQDPLSLYKSLFFGTWGSVYGVGQVLFKATPLVCTGLSVAVALRAGLFNVGAEGQIIVGALLAALCGAALPAQTPSVLAVPLCLFAAFFAGGVLGGLVGLSKCLCGAHEVIVTILQNFLVRAAMVGVGGFLFVKESVHTAVIIDAARLPRLSSFVSALHGSAVNAALGLSLLLAVFVELVLRKTRFGFAVRVVGQNPDAAAAAGISIAKIQTLAFVLAGGLAGLGGANFVLGYKLYYEDGFSSGVGYWGIAVAVLAHNRPLWILGSALFFGTLLQGGLSVAAMVPRELVDVLSAVVILVVATSRAELAHLVPRLVRAKRAETGLDGPSGPTPRPVLTDETQHEPTMPPSKPGGDVASRAALWETR